MMEVQNENLSIHIDISVYFV